ncbi:MAG TPA: secretin N-terminal domain-containing protein [bacterium]
MPELVSRVRRFFGATAISLLAFSNGASQTSKLQSIEMFNLGDVQRILVECSGRVNYVSQFQDSPPQLILYLRDSKLDLPENKIRINRRVVRDVEAVQWRLPAQAGKSPAVVKVTFSLARAMEYEITQKMDRLLFIELKELAAARDTNGPATAMNGFANLDDVVPSTTSHNGSVDISKSQRLPNVLQSRELISLDVKAAEIANVLRLLAKQSDLNIVASRDVTGPVTVSLTNVTIKDALDMVVKANGFDYVVQGEVIVVKPREKFELPELETKVFRLKYVDANNMKTTLMQMLSEKAKLQVFNQDFHPPQEPGQGQTVARKNRSSILVVTDVPANMRQLEAMVTALDVPTAQIMIEAKLIEIAPQEEDQLGIDWSKTINASIFNEVLLPSGKSLQYSAQAPLEGGGGVSFGTLSFSEYGAVIDFLKSHTNSKLVSNPRILAMDNQEATISVGTNVPIPQINRGVGGQGDVVTFQYRDVNISLRVTPHVAEDQTLTLFVNPIIEEITGQVVAGENSAPITSKREVETVVNLKSGDTVVIGGLIKESAIDKLDKVWLLGDVPLIGNLFRHKTKSVRQTDLLIFITPRLMTAP